MTMRLALCSLLAASAFAADEETYAVVAYGHARFVVAGLVLGRVLARVDPARPRTAVVFGLEDADAAALAAVWDVRASAAFARYVAQGRRPGVDATGKHVWKGRKMDLWALPFAKVVAFDLDTTLVAGPGLRPALDRLFAYDVAPGEVVAKAQLGAPPGACFETSVLVLRPDAASRLAYERGVNKGWAKSACRGHDQPYLNFLFDGRWRPVFEAWHGAMATPDPAKPYVMTPACGAEAAAVHFYHYEAPWTARCAMCLAADRLCATRNVSGACPEAMTRAQRAWWAEVVGLPPALRAYAEDVLLAENEGAPACL